MAIKQDRMLALIAEAVGFRDAYKELLVIIDKWGRSERSMNGVTGDALLSLQMEIRFIKQPRETRIAIEEYHFTRNRKRNESERARQTQRRLLKRISREPMPDRRRSNPTFHEQPPLEQLVKSMAENDPLEALDLGGLSDAPMETDEEMLVRFQQEGMTEKQAKAQIAGLKAELGDI